MAYFVGSEVEEGAWLVVILVVEGELASFIHVGEHQFELETFIVFQVGVATTDEYFILL